MGHRLIEVPADRLARWVAGFTERHGPARQDLTPDALTLRAASGAVARLDVPFGPADLVDARELCDLVSELAQRAGWAADSLLLLVRRGGVAVGVARAGVLTAHHNDRRYVQSRTAAGGWSQQRFARRRAGQAAGLVDAAVRNAARVFEGRVSDSRALVVGGDRALLGQVLAAPALRPVTTLARSALLDVPDPRLSVLEDALRRAQCVRVHLDQP